MHQKTWLHTHLCALTFAFDRGWRRHRRQWCVHQLFAGRFQGNSGAYQKWRVGLLFKPALAAHIAGLPTVVSAATVTVAVVGPISNNDIVDLF